MSHKALSRGTAYAWLFPGVAKRGGKVQCYSSCLRPGYNKHSSNPRGYHWAQDFARYVLNGVWYSLRGEVIALARGGKVLEVGWNAYWGWTTLLQCTDGLFWRYAHLLKKPGWSVGATFASGYRFGYVGNTGNSKGDHLHLEVSATRARDPRFDPYTAFNRSRFPTFAY